MAGDAGSRAEAASRYGKPRRRALPYLLGLGLVAAIVALWLSLNTTWGANVPFLAFLIPVAAGALAGGLGPGLFAAVLGAVAAIYVGAPRFALTLHNPSEWLILAVFAAQGPLTAVGCARLRRALAQSRADRDALRDLNAEIERRAREEAHRLASLVEERTAALAVQSAERTALSAGLREAEEITRRQADLLDQSYDAVVVWKLGDGIVYWNRGARVLYGWSAEEARGRVSHELLATMPPGGEIAAVEEALAREGRWEGQLTHRTRDGRRITVESRHLAVHYGDEILVLETNRDVTARVEAEADRERLLQSEQVARGEAERAARLKDEFLGTLSHELRTPLNAMVGWLALLRKGGLDREAAEKALGVIERNTRVLTQLIDDLLDVSRIVAGKLRLDVRDVDLADVIEGATSSVSPSAVAKNIRIEKILDTGAGVVRGDAVRLQQVVWNLLSNAVKFTPKGGRIRVILRRVESSAEIAVSDTGQGIHAEFLPHVFERFRQQDASTTRAHGGLGLGLSLVRHIVELHGGSVRVESEGEGRGAVFSVSLPIAAATSVSRVNEGEPPPPPSGVIRGVKVLVVDDEEDTRELVQHILTAYDADVLAVGSASEALDQIDRFQPDVLLSDIGMPQQDGYQLLRRLRKLGPNEGGATPAVALTAFARAEDRRRALRAGYQIHVSKPVDAGELVTIIANLAGRAR